VSPRTKRTESLKLILRICITSILWPTLFAPICLAENETSIFAPASDEIVQVAIANVPPEPSSLEETPESISDPLEPVNRAFFKFNDKLYFWILKPLAIGYQTVVPEGGRVGVRNFFSNLTTPIRLVNCLLQVNFKGAGNETVRLLVNTAFGVVGFLDVAKNELNIEKSEEDFGQTLGFWGIGSGIYIDWPIFGPSSLRDTAGFFGDLFLDPRTYIFNRPIFYVLRPYEIVNDTSLRIGEYEDFKESAVDPYTALKDAYHQYRQTKIRQR
jgi:phospholipid-binding lipoprotein MlaA